MNILLNKHFKILNFNPIDEFNKENIKNSYKKIALSCHPDKLNNIKDENEKQEKIEKFKEATISYNYLLKYLDDSKKDFGNIGGIFDNFEDFSDDIDMTEYFNMFKDFSEFTDYNNEDNIKKSVFSTMTDLASLFLKQNIKPKSYYYPSNDIIKHNIELPVNINDIYSDKKKKLELILKNVKEPIMIDIYCGCLNSKSPFPTIIKQYIDDDGKEHEIIISLKITKNNKHKILKKYRHIICENGSIDLITTIEISLLEYLTGTKKNIVFIDGSIININIPAFECDKIIKRKYGLNNGNLIINIYLKNIIQSEWNKLDNDSKDNVIRILKTI
jgi:DnaJ-class molecular chaperone